MFSLSVIYAVWIITILEPLQKTLPREGRRGGRVSAEGLSGAEISRRCGFQGHCNLKITRILTLMVEQKILRTVYPQNSKVMMYALATDLSNVTMLDLVTLFDYGARFGEPDLYREMTLDLCTEPLLKKFVDFSAEMKQNINQQLQKVPVADILNERPVMK